jgi:hypothetical protein
MTSVVSGAYHLFLFWSSSMILKKLISRITDQIKRDETTQLNTSNAIVILGSSFVGSLAFTYSDSFV